MLKRTVMMLGTVWCLAVGVVQAADYSDPYVLVDQAAEKTFTRLKQDKAAIAKNPELLRTIIREEMLPFVDERYAAFKVLGNNIKQTNPAQRDEFVTVFTEYMVSSYADALAKFDDQVITVEAPKPIGNQTMASVAVTVSDDGKPDIILDFKLRKNLKSNEWRAFDLVAEGISLLSAKQSELSTPLRQDGIDQVIAQLRAHNAKPLVLKK